MRVVMTPFTRFMVIGAVSLVLVGLAAHAGANLMAGRGLMKELERIRSREEPLTLEEAAPPAIPDVENAALIYNAAFRLAPQGRQDQRLRLQLISRFISAEPDKSESVSIDEARAALALMEPMLARVRKAAAMPKCRFPVQWSKGFAATFPHPSQLRDTVRYLAADARVRAYEGNAEGAVDDIETMTLMVRHLSMEPTLIDQLTVYVMLSTIQESLQAVMETVQLNASQHDRLYRLLSEFDVYGPYAQTLELERCLGILAFEQLPHDPAEAAALFGPDEKTGREPVLLTTRMPRLWSPFFKKDETFYLQSMARAIEQARAGRSSSVRKHAHEVTGSPAYAQISRQLLEALPQTLNKRDSAVARLGLCQWALALSLYRQREGRYPVSLSEIEESTRWSLPLDPFTGKPFLYHHDGDGYTLYGVGPNGRDDRGIRDEGRRGGTRESEEPGPIPETKADDIAWRFRLNS